MQFCPQLQVRERDASKCYKKKMLNMSTLAESLTLKTAFQLCDKTDVITLTLRNLHDSGLSKVALSYIDTHC